MPFTDSQIEHYRSRGYVAGPRVLSDEQIEELKERIEDILHGRVPFPKHLMGETVEQSRAKGQLPSVKVVNIFRRDPLFAAIIGNPAISALAHQLMPGPVRMWEDQMIYKPPHDEETALAWHQDYTFWDHVGPADLGTCWIALDDATVDNGCMHVIPGSHLWPMRYAREDAAVDDPHWLLRQEGIPAGADLTPVPCEVPAGHCHFHHCKTFHGSYGNSTGNPRRSYIMHLMPGHTRRLGDNWNERMGNVETVGVGEVLRGEEYPELVAICAGSRHPFPPSLPIRGHPPNKPRLTRTPCANSLDCLTRPPAPNPPHGTEAPNPSLPEHSAHHCPSKDLSPSKDPHGRRIWIPATPTPPHSSRPHAHHSLTTRDRSHPSEQCTAPLH